MSLLWHKLVRDLFQIRGRVLALLLIIGAGSGIFFGIQLALSNLMSTQQRMLDQLQVADIEVQLLPEDRNNLPDLSQIPDIETVESRLVFPGMIELSDGRPLTTLMIFQDRPSMTLNHLQLLQGALPVQWGEEVLIDRALAQFHGYKVGDRISVKVGRKVFERRIGGIVVSPEFLVTSSNPEYVVQSPVPLAWFGEIWTSCVPALASAWSIACCCGCVRELIRKRSWPQSPWVSGVSMWSVWFRRAKATAPDKSGWRSRHSPSTARPSLLPSCCWHWPWE